MSVATKAKWFESLPANCPPDKAFRPDNLICYRLVSTTPPEIEEFYSLRKINPKKKYNATECITRAVSVFTDIEEAAIVNKLPLHKKKVPLKLTLKKSCGKIKNTGKYKSHYSWWAASEFLKNIEIEELK